MRFVSLSARERDDRRIATLLRPVKNKTCSSSSTKLTSPHRFVRATTIIFYSLIRARDQPRFLECGTRRARHDFYTRPKWTTPPGFSHVPPFPSPSIHYFSYASFLRVLYLLYERIQQPPRDERTPKVQVAERSIIPPPSHPIRSRKIRGLKNHLSSELSLLTLFLLLVLFFRPRRRRCKTCYFRFSKRERRKRFFRFYKSAHKRVIVFAGSMKKKKKNAERHRRHGSKARQKLYVSRESKK